MRQEELAPRENVASDDMQRNRQVLEALVQEVASDQAPERATGNQVPANAEEPE